MVSDRSGYVISEFRPSAYLIRKTDKNAEILFFMQGKRQRYKTHTAFLFLISSQS